MFAVRVVADFPGADDTVAEGALGLVALLEEVEAGFGEALRGHDLGDGPVDKRLEAHGLVSQGGAGVGDCGVACGGGSGDFRNIT